VFPGGGSPIGFYMGLARENLDWSKTQILISDERLVGENNSISNIYMLKRHLINKIESDTVPQLLAFPYLKNQRVKYDNEDFLKKIITESLPEVCILGIGEDGHTASLFPYRSDFNNTKLSIVVKKNEEDLNRVSLTYRFLSQAKRLAFIISGEHKADIFQDILSGPYQPDKYPVQYFFKNYHNAIDIFCDKKAFKKLNQNAVINEELKIDNF